LKYSWFEFKLQLERQKVFSAIISLSLLFCLAPSLSAQTAYDERPIPILTGNAGYFTTVDRGSSELAPEINPVLLLPLGNRWLVEARAGFEGDFARQDPNGPYKGVVSKDIDYLQADYIANRYVTVTAGRFLTPFGIYNERLYPIWIRDLHEVPLIFGLNPESSDGVMLRGGFAVSSKANLNYATYFSANSSVNKFESDRMAGGRVGFFFPGPRVEVGASFRKELQEDRTNAFGFHFAWQPMRVPLNLRSEYTRSHNGSGYWVEGAYRFNQVNFWRAAMRRTEFVARMQQFFIGEETDTSELDEYELPHGNVRQPDFGLNFYLHDGLKASASYGRWLGTHNWNVWTMGIAYRFALPLGPTGAR
jgi:hypothetical protein